MNPDLENAARCKAPYFHCEDWCSFALATVLVFSGYWFSLAGNVGLGFSGIFSVGANYMGVPHPPGYPIWTIYGWLFTRLLPISNIAWRLAISSTVAGALTCGVIALMVSRSSRTLLDGINGFQKLPPRDDRMLRIVAGGVAGMTFGFDSAFARKAVIVDVWPLSMLLFGVTLCLLLRWAHEPERKRFLVAACFLFGLTITNSQALIPAGLGLLLLVAFTEKNTGRDAALVATSLLAIWRIGSSLNLLPFGGSTACRAPVFETGLILGLMTILTLGLYVGLATTTHRWLPSWTIGFATLAFFAGAAGYLLVPVFSMSNPPMNWGYPRNLEGFAHVLNREQYEHLRPVADAGVYLQQIWQFARSTLQNFGVMPTAIALILVGFLFRVSVAMRRQMIGGTAAFASLSLLLVALLNPHPDRQSTDLVATYYTPLHLLLAISLGHGLVLLGTLLSRGRTVN